MNYLGIFIVLSFLLNYTCVSNSAARASVPQRVTAATVVAIVAAAAAVVLLAVAGRA